MPPAKRLNILLRCTAETILSLNRSPGSEIVMVTRFDYRIAAETGGCEMDSASLARSAEPAASFFKGCTA
jgi:hypothetical protein